MVWVICALASANLVSVWVAVWVLSNIRDDQLIIRTFIANVLRERRALMGAPMEDEAFHQWLREHPDRPTPDRRTNMERWLADNPDRPHKNDPPMPRSPS